MGEGIHSNYSTGSRRNDWRFGRAIHSEFILTKKENETFTLSKEELDERGKLGIDLRGDNSILPLRWIIRPFLQILPQLVKRMKLADIMR